MIKPVYKIALCTAGLFGTALTGYGIRQSSDMPLTEVRPDLHLDSFDLNKNQRIDTFKPKSGEMHLTNCILTDGDRAVSEGKNLVDSFDLDKDGFLNSWERSEIERLIKDLDEQNRTNLWTSARLIDAAKNHAIAEQECRLLTEVRELKKALQSQESPSTNNTNTLAQELK